MYQLPCSHKSFCQQCWRTYE